MQQLAGLTAAHRWNNQYLCIGRDLRRQPVGKTDGIFSHKDVDVRANLALLVDDPVTQAGLGLPQRFQRRRHASRRTFDQE